MKEEKNTYYECKCFYFFQNLKSISKCCLIFYIYCCFSVESCSLTYEVSWSKRFKKNIIRHYLNEMVSENSKKDHNYSWNSTNGTRAPLFGSSSAKLTAWNFAAARPALRKISGSTWGARPPLFGRPSASSRNFFRQLSKHGFCLWFFRFFLNLFFDFQLISIKFQH